MVVVLSLGFFISVIAKNQFAASQIALLITFLPAFLLSGFLFSIEQMPVSLQWITRILPARYYVSVLKKIFLKGTPAAMLYADLVPLAVFALVLALLATRSHFTRGWSRGGEAMLARLKQMLIKEFIQVFRDKRTRFILIRAADHPDAGLRLRGDLRDSSCVRRWCSIWITARRAAN